MSSHWETAIQFTRYLVNTLLPTTLAKPAHRYLAYLIVITPLTIADVELPGDVEVYLKNLTSSNVRSLQELVDWNIAHSEDALPPGMPFSPLRMIAYEC